MDTNTIALLMQMMAQKQAASAVSWSSITQIVILVLAAITSWRADMSSKKAMVSSNKALENTEAIHVAVNSERTLMLSDNAKLKEEKLILSQKLAAFEERQRMQDLKDAAKIPIVAPSLAQADITQIAEAVVKAQA